MLKAENLVFEYIRRNENGDVEAIHRAVDEVDFQVKKGSFTVILGHNGSGKSTLARHINALLTPSEGQLIVDGMDTRDGDSLKKIRQTAGMIFQNPENQFVANVIEEDVGFGPENLGVPTKKIWERVEEALLAVGMLKHRKQSPNHLSGGQKQRAAIAGVIAMKPKCIVADEPTAMLDPSGRKEVIHTLHKLNKEEKITVILITHNMEETINADQILVMDHGRIVMEGTPKEIFSRSEEVERYGLRVPYAVKMAELLRKKGISLPDGILTKEELADALTVYWKQHGRQR